MTTVLVANEGNVAVLTLNRPDKLNALNEEVLRELAYALDACTQAGARCAVLTGAGDRAFAAGADIAAMKDLGPAGALRFARLGHAVARAMEDAPFPIIAAVNGFALGGGCELALACDFVYASDKAKFGQPEVNLGVIPGFGGTQRLARLVGPSRARELCMTGDVVSADDALRMGLANKVVAHEALLPEARETAKKIAAKAPLAVAAVRTAVLRGQDVPLPTANELEAAAFAALFASGDQKEGMAAFLEKRPATFRGN